MNRTTWLIWSNEHLGWWRYNNRGYTKELKFARRFTAAQALKQVNDSNKYGWFRKCELLETMVPLSSLPQSQPDVRDNPEEKA